MQYEVGDTVTYTAFGGERRTVIVTEKYEDVKNGYPGFDAVWPMIAADECVWGYDDQIIQVERKA
jgi:hypothetical protein